MKNNLLPFLLVIVSFSISSCLSVKEVRYLEPNENLTLNEEGLIPYNIQEYRVTENDILRLNIVTTPKGDAAQFYSSLNTYIGGERSETGGGAINRGNIGGQGNNFNRGSGNDSAGNSMFYFNGLKVDRNGDVYIFGIGYIKAVGRTLAEIQKEVQERVNENFLEGKSEVRIDTDGITYYILGDMETTGLTGEKVAYKNTLTLTEAISSNGGLNRTVDRKNVVLRRKYPEGIKTVKLDLTREDIMNSPYFWVQNGDEIYLNTRPKSMNGFGKDPLQTLTTGVSLLTTVMSIYLIITKL